MKKIIKNKFLFAVVILVIVGIIGVIFSAVKFSAFSDFRLNASSSVVLSYKGASDGLAPDGTLFAKETIVTEEIVEKALSELSLSEKYTAKAIMQSIAVTAFCPKDISSQLVKYKSMNNVDSASVSSVSIKVESNRPTTFNVTLYNGFDKTISEKKLVELLDCILKNSKECFIERYSFGFDGKAIEGIFGIDSCDYAEKADILSARLDAIASFAQGFIDRNGAFSDSGASMKDIVLKSGSLKADELGSISSFIKLQGISSDPKTLISTYEYIVSSEKEKLSELGKKLDAITNTIETYPNNSDVIVITGTGSQMISGNSEATYNQLVQMKSICSAEITALSSEISQNEAFIEALRTSSGSASVIENKLSALNTQIDGLEDSLNALLDAYNAKYVASENGISVSKIKAEKHSLASKEFIVSAIKTAATFCVIALALILAYSFVREAKNAKKSK